MDNIYTIPPELNNPMGLLIVKHLQTIITEVNSIAAPSSDVVLSHATKTLVAAGDDDETTIVLGSEFQPPLTKVPRVIKVYDNTGAEIQGLSISRALNNGVYDITIGLDTDGHENAEINAICY